jgi:protein-tyrosine-phosphatase
MKKIMFVCTGNICRSPMAQYYMQKRVFDLKKENEYYIISAGTNAQNGQRATINAVEAMKKYNINMENHRATNIMDSEVLSCDLIFTLTKNHKDILIRMFPELIGKVYTLIEYISPDQEYIDIDDPWGYDINVYTECARQIVNSVDKLLEKL